MLSDRNELAIRVVEKKSQCTFWCSVLSDTAVSEALKNVLDKRLNAPSGAQCFPTVCYGVDCKEVSVMVSMHLLVLSAFRLGATYCSDPRHYQSQCTFWCSVLSDTLNMSV